MKSLGAAWARPR